MVFNVLAHNRDDHVKNFAFLYKPEEGWMLAPGFDLTFTEGPGGEHTTSVCGEGRAPGREQFRRVAAGVGIRASEAAQIEDEVLAAVNRWPSFARDCGVLNKVVSPRRLSSVESFFKTCPDFNAPQYRFQGGGLDYICLLKKNRTTTH
jgi:serine/threonine-protein kinase HipA